MFDVYFLHMFDVYFLHMFESKDYIHVRAALGMTIWRNTIYMIV